MRSRWKLPDLLYFNTAIHIEQHQQNKAVEKSPEPASAKTPNNGFLAHYSPMHDAFKTAKSPTP
jgi:hypothetical protein